MGLQQIPGSRCVEYRGFEIEVAEVGVLNYPEILDRSREEVFALAARSRGWSELAALDLFRRKFIIEPLYQVDSLASIRRGGCLVGMAGAVTNWNVTGKSVVHLSSLGLMPEAQIRGFLPALLATLLARTLRDLLLPYEEGRAKVFVSAITQSPYILAFLNQLVHIYPSPYRAGVSEEEKEIAKAVAARFAPGVHFESEKFILRRECQFSYRRTPYSRDRRFNQFCDLNLHYEQGDVFVTVGQLIPSAIWEYCKRVRDSFPELLSLLLDEQPVSADALLVEHGPQHGR